MISKGENRDRLAYLEERVRYLEEANRSYIALLDVLSSNGEFQADLSREKSIEGIHRATLAQLGRLFPFRMMGILMSREDSSFELFQCEPAACRGSILREVDRSIQEGTFAWALNRSQALTIPSPSGDHTLLLHVIATQNRISGMFIGMLSGANRIIDAPALNALSNILHTSAYAMESSTLYSMLRENLETLEVKVQERTAELQAARDQAESSARELKASNDKLCREIAERERTEKALQESEENYRRLVELSPEAIYICSEGRLIFSNASGAILLGANSAEELCGRAIIDFIQDDQRDSVQKRIKDLRKKGESSRLIEGMVIRLDGSSIPVETAAIPFTYRGVSSILIVARDVSERIKMQDEQIKAQKLESLGVFAGGIAHDFNNILTSILANLSFARMQLSPSHLIVKRLEECEKATVRASELTQQLLTFARGGEPAKRLIDPTPLIREATSFILRGSTVKSIIDLPSGLWTVEADGGQLSQSLHNLLINAAQAMPNGGEVNVRAGNVVLDRDNLYRLPQGSYLKISVKDHGCGIPPENLARIFDPYFTTKSQGSGLGLASVYSIMKRHGGTVGITSTIGVGSCFEILLPASPGKGPDIFSVNASSEKPGGGKVLIMDDEDYIRDIAAEILRYMGFEVESCADGREAVEFYLRAMANNTPFAAVILDLTIPGGMGGREAASLILEKDPGAVLIVSSGYSNDPIIANYQSFGFSGAIRKPFDSNTLAGELRRVNRRKN
jgi:PAS domain S-box-containing protein